MVIWGGYIWRKFSNISISMIINAPSEDGLNEIALKLYFKAWDTIIQIISEIPGGWLNSDKMIGDWSDENDAYIELSQGDLQSALSIMQQSNELALKARIVSVSPFLLLSNVKGCLTEKQGDIEFSDIRTIDASDLTRAVNVFCSEKLSHNYVEFYQKMRTLRNQYTHLGSISTNLDPQSMLDDLIDQYLELWPDRIWLHDRVKSAYKGLGSYFEDKNWSPTQSIMFGLPLDFYAIRGDRFKRLFNILRSEIIFCCCNCRNDWAIERMGPSPKDSKTAYFDHDSNVIICLMCGERFSISGDQCRCTSEFVSIPTEIHKKGFCFACGNESENDNDDFDAIIAPPIVL